MIEEIIISVIAGALVGCTFYQAWIMDEHLRLKYANDRLKIRILN